METWRKIPSAPDYDASSLGNFRMSREPLRKRKYPNPKPVTLKRGYAYIVLRVGGKSKTFQAHRLIAEAFLGHSKLQVNHINGVRNDNRIENLEYVTSAQNQQHSRDVLGTFAQGERHHNSKLTREDVLKAFALRKRGKSTYEIGEELGCTATNVQLILKRKAWGHVAIPPHLLS